MIFVYNANKIDLTPDYPNGELALGVQLNKNFAAEMNLGYFYTGIEQEIPVTIITNGNSFMTSGREEVNIDVLPVTLALKGIIPYKKWEFFALGGLGAYFVWAKNKISVLSFSGKIDGNDIVFGAYVGVGIHYNLTKQFFIGAEGKYLLTDRANIERGYKFNLNGFITNAVIGFRF
jgi:opacity protein-like surface antigen